MGRILKPTQYDPSVQEIGKLRKGGAKRKREKNGKEYDIFGEDLTYWRFDANSKLLEYPPVTQGFNNLAEELQCRFEDAFGTEPRRVEILFPYPSIAQVWKSGNTVWSETAGGNKCVRRCDGEKCTLHLDAKGNLSRDVIPCVAGETEDCPAGCKAEGQLTFFIPALGYPGTVSLVTHSFRDIKTISRNLEAWRWIDLRSVRFWLCREEKPYEYQDPNGNTKSGKKWFAHLEIAPQYTAFLLQQQQEHSQRLMAMPPQRLALASADEPYVPSEFVKERSLSGTFRQRIINAAKAVGKTDKIQAIATQALNREINSASDILNEQECLLVEEALLKG